mmetsp:Transcript_8230/g.23357  ORF Transcript_8230/g.23357 Transcript_8230/m.23357 type:complete len:351 (-) Transcript_8230:350-1402(-)
MRFCTPRNQSTEDGLVESKTSTARSQSTMQLERASSRASLSVPTSVRQKKRAPVPCGLPLPPPWTRMREIALRKRSVRRSSSPTNSDANVQLEGLPFIPEPMPRCCSDTPAGRRPLGPPVPAAAAPGCPMSASSSDDLPTPCAPNTKARTTLRSSELHSFSTERGRVATSADSLVRSKPRKYRYRRVRRGCSRVTMAHSASHPASVTLPLSSTRVPAGKSPSSAQVALLGPSRRSASAASALSRSWSAPALPLLLAVALAESRVRGERPWASELPPRWPSSQGPRRDGQMLKRFSSSRGDKAWSLSWSNWWNRSAKKVSARLLSSSERSRTPKSLFQPAASERSSAAAGI